MVEGLYRGHFMASAMTFLLSSLIMSFCSKLRGYFIVSSMTFSLSSLIMSFFRSYMEKNQLQVTLIYARMEIE